MKSASLWKEGDEEDHEQSEIKDIDKFNDKRRAKGANELGKQIGFANTKMRLGRQKKVQQTIFISKSKFHSPLTMLTKNIHQRLEYVRKCGPVVDRTEELREFYENQRKEKEKEKASKSDIC